jgi:hypothetical protein
MKNSMLSLLFGVLIGGLLVFFLKPSGGGGSFTPITVLGPTPATEAKSMILNLYSELSRTDINLDSVRKLFRKSYIINANDIRGILIKYPNADFVRIYPALGKDDNDVKMLSFILMIQEKGRMIWDGNSLNPKKQDEIQDQWGPCPNRCPTSNELIIEDEWKIFYKEFPHLNPQKTL